MARFNISAAPHTVIDTARSTYEGGLAEPRPPRLELFLSAVSSMSEPTFYESEHDRRHRQRTLVRTVAVEDPDWMLEFLRWLRLGANIRTAAVTLAADSVKARLDADRRGFNRRFIDVVLQRADEPGEMLAYWTATYGRNVPAPVKRGVADAVVRLYNQRSFLKYDSARRSWRFGDVIDFVHPTPSDDS